MTPKANGSRYIGNKNSKKFHRPDCRWAAEIAPHNRVEFKSREEAVAAGYVPCKVCRP
ncbi:Ada metal-binding domain-containing protein [Desulfofundulus salinus]|uniref:Ada metal-binding domain-containing protein n=1 Tax=Desulfofundulus salinus TaxID=2419843 RepID=UPI003F4905B8